MKASSIILNTSLTTSKVVQLADAIKNAIHSFALAEGTLLPSVNEISNELNIARDTVFKAYLQLKKLGIVESTRAKGYFVANAKGRILLFLDAYSTYKDALYNAFNKMIQHQYSVDIAFHHYNQSVFETVIGHSAGKYNYYVVMNVAYGELHPALLKVPKEKLLMLDWGNFSAAGLSFVNQDFGKAPYDCLVAEIALIKKYCKFIYVNNPASHHPAETQIWFQQLCKEQAFEYEILSNINPEHIQRGSFFLLVHHLDVVTLIKTAQEKQLIIGTDIGIVCYNDSPMFEVIDKGITVLSTNFQLMGQQAANAILHKQPIQETVPTSLTKRGSL